MESESKKKGISYRKQNGGKSESKRLLLQERRSLHDEMHM